MKFILWLIFGLLLGPSVLAIKSPEWFNGASQAAGGIFLFLAGWEMRFLNLYPDRKFYLLAFVGSFVVPAVTGWVVFQNFFMAMAMGISALPITIQLLKEKGLYATSLARRSITLASLCDIGAWLALVWLLPAESVGAWVLSHWIVLAFFVGLLLGRIIEWPTQKSFLIHAQTWILAPLFFLGLGWKIDLWRLFDLKSFLTVFILAVATKSVGSYVFSRWAGANHKDSWNLAAILNARGAMEILAANFAYDAGLISGPLFSALVLLGILTAVMAVPLVRK
ncbi:hypothetical protein AZI86_02345 [Bdellovibrio bacteriovorus]|uniref:Cation/H+ exchanger transmembrane domain-containing protein n=1 Tax=Bdellovibrio bacteriovorus TaxID=959 RepID=A0A150WN71_BDEBC|nr:cation:proton antiporter [Bdellovibrio bacteriovorus]KYG65931.1 hypothetical protein AZI86_02345 [Bdellovibrio bacteriovorus]